MAEGDLITGDWQVEWLGLLLAPSAGYVLTEIAGLDLPEVRSSDHPFPRAHGEVRRQLDYKSGRDLTITVRVEGTSASHLETLLRPLEARIEPFGDGLPQPLVIKIAGRDAVRVMAVPRRYARPIVFEYATGWVAETVIQWRCPDPLVYSNSLSTLVVGRQLPGEGFEPPFEVPFGPPESTSGVVNVLNAGTVPAPWEARLDGPLEQPIVDIIQNGTQRALSFTANGGIDLSAGQYVLLSSQDRSVRLSGSSDRRSQLALTSAWWSLLPGNNFFRLRAEDGAGTLTVYARSAWPA